MKTGGPQTPRQSEQQSARWPLFGPLVIVPLLLVLSPFVPNLRLFGMDQWAVLPQWLRLVFLGIYTATFAVTLARSRQTSQESAQPRKESPISLFLWWLGGGALLGFLFLYFRSQSFFYGDGFMVLASAEKPFFSAIAGDEAVKVLTVLACRLAQGMLGPHFAAGSGWPIAILSAAAGLVATAGLVRLIQELTEDHTARLFLIASSLTSGCVVLCFGWVEHYTIPLAALIWGIYFSVRYFMQRAPFWQPIVVWLVAAGCALELVPLLLVFVVIASVSEKTPLGNARNLNVALALASFAGAAIFFFALPSVSIVPALPSSQSPYWAFSGSHLLDMLNITLLVAPVGMFYLIALTTGKKLRPANRQERFLSAAAVTLFLIFFWIEPILGAPRDWDLLSLYGIPLTLFASYFVVKAYSIRAIKVMIAPLLVLALLLIGPNVYEKHVSSIAIARLDRLLWDDPHYQTSYNEGVRGITWGSMMQGQIQRPDLGEKYLWRRLAAVPFDDITWFNIGEIQFGRNRFDSAAVAFGKAYQAWPDHDLYLVRYVQALQGIKSKDVEAYLPRIAAIRTDTLKILRLASTVLTNAGKMREAIPILQKASKLAPTDGTLLTNLAVAFHYIGQSDSASFYFRAAIPLSASADRPRLYMGLIGEYAAAKRIDEARATAAEFIGQYPNDPSALAAQQFLNGKQ